VRRARGARRGGREFSLYTCGWVGVARRTRGCWANMGRGLTGINFYADQRRERARGGGAGRRKRAAALRPRETPRGGRMSGDDGSGARSRKYLHTDCSKHTRQRPRAVSRKRTHDLRSCRSFVDPVAYSRTRPHACCARTHADTRPRCSSPIHFCIKNVVLPGNSAVPTHPPQRSLAPSSKSAQRVNQSSRTTHHRTHHAPYCELLMPSVRCSASQRGGSSSKM
jgi:hypothetical protein